MSMYRHIASNEFPKCDALWNKIGEKLPHISLGFAVAWAAGRVTLPLEEKPYLLDGQLSKAKAVAANRGLCIAKQYDDFLMPTIVRNTLGLDTIRIYTLMVSEWPTTASLSSVPVGIRTNILKLVDDINASRLVVNLQFLSDRHGQIPECGIGIWRSGGQFAVVDISMCGVAPVFTDAEFCMGHLGMAVSRFLAHYQVEVATVIQTRILVPEPKKPLTIG